MAMRLSGGDYNMRGNSFTAQITPRADRAAHYAVSKIIATPALAEMTIIN